MFDKEPNPHLTWLHLPACYEAPAAVPRCQRRYEWPLIVWGR
jgi:hypothetical protein